MRIGKRKPEAEAVLRRELREQQAVVERAARAARRGVSPVEQERLIAEMEPAAARAGEIRRELEASDRSLQRPRGSRPRRAARSGRRRARRSGTGTRRCSRNRPSGVVSRGSSTTRRRRRRRVSVTSSASRPD